MPSDLASVGHWTARLRDFIPGYFAHTPALRSLTSHCPIVLHGSTTLGVDDAFSDLDLWLLMDSEKLKQAESIAGTRFFSFELDGKKGHFNLESSTEFAERVRQCDMELIAELRRGEILSDFDGVAGNLVSAARKSMSDQVRRAWFFYHYVEMRGAHRGCDNPIERGDALALLQALVPTINHALRAAMVLDGEPYPYTKWLGSAATRTPTGHRLSPLVREILGLLSEGALRRAGPESTHPISLKLREIRKALLDEARSKGIDEPWLERWWEYLIPAKDAIRAITW